jgi:hypothetical protein
MYACTLVCMIHMPNIHFYNQQRLREKYTYVHVYIYIYIYIYTHTHTHTQTHIYTHRCSPKRLCEEYYAHIHGYTNQSHSSLPSTETLQRHTLGYVQHWPQLTDRDMYIHVSVHTDFACSPSTETLQRHTLGTNLLIQIRTHAYVCITTKLFYIHRDFTKAYTKQLHEVSPKGKPQISGSSQQVDAEREKKS